MHRFLVWAPRALALATAGFVGLFALDAFEEGRSLGENLLAFLVHLVPALALLATLALAWRWPLIGAAAFGAAGLAYAVWVGGRHLDWVAVISGPLVATALLYLASWRFAPRRAVGPEAASG
jgi:hypothetical protein